MDTIPTVSAEKRRWVARWVTDATDEHGQRIISVDVSHDARRRRYDAVATVATRTPSGVFRYQVGTDPWVVLGTQPAGRFSAPALQRFFDDTLRGFDPGVFAETYC